MGSWNGAWQGSTYLDLSTTGATLGSQALLVSSGGEWSLQYAFATPIALPVGTKLTMDVTMTAADATALTGWGAFCADFAINSNGPSGWSQISWSPLVTAIDHTGGTGTAIDFGPWDTAGFSRTYTIDLGGMNYNSTGATYMQLNFGFQTPGLATIYVDNVQLTPEPATMALLGLGGLALIRRKK
jgi:hypothetical protein